MDTLDQQNHTREALARDAAQSEPLRRVNYAPGMMLGLEATRDEQSYHLRRLTRHQYWLHGYGTIVGMHVGADTRQERVVLVVSPGLGIDGFGREVLVNEPYCVDVAHFIATVAQTDPAFLAEAREGGANRISLAVLARHDSCLTHLGPTVAQKLNQGTDTVAFGRSTDALALRLVPLVRYRNPQGPWAQHQPPALDAEGTALVNARPPADRPLFEARLRRVVTFREASSLDAAVEVHERAERAEIALASVTLPYDFAADALFAGFGEADLQIDNMMREFVALTDEVERFAGI